MKGLAFGLAVVVAALPGVQATMTLDYGPVYQGPLDEIVDPQPLPHIPDCVSIGIIPPVVNPHPECLDGHAPNAQAQQNETSGDE